MPRCIDSLKPPGDTFFHPKYMIRFKTTKTACSTPLDVHEKTLYMSFSEKKVNHTDELSFFSPRVFIASVYNIFNLDDLVVWAQNAHTFEEETVNRVLDMAWDGLFTKESFTDPELFEKVATVYKTVLQDVQEGDIQRALQRAYKDHWGQKLSYHSKKSYQKIIKKLLVKK